MNLPLAIGLLLFGLFFVAYVGIKLLKIPDIVIYVLVGTALSLTGVYGDTDVFKVAGEIGLIILFFLLGMKFTFPDLKEKGKYVWKASILDVVLGVGVTLGLALLMGFDFFTSFLVASLVYATSSSITVKLLENKGKLDARAAGFMLSLLIFEDLITPILITVLMGLQGESFTALDFLYIFLKLVALVVGAFIISKVVLHKIHDIIKRFIDEDYFVLFVLGVAISYGGLALALGLSEVIGAFLAGIIFSETKFRDKVQEVAMPARNLFLPFFFLNFGLTMKFNGEIPAWGLLAVIIIWSFISKGIIGYFGGKWYGLSNKESFETGLALSPRGEFSVIIAGIATGALQIFSGIYILIMALVGMGLFQAAPLLGQKLYKNENSPTIKDNET